MCPAVVMRFDKRFAFLAGALIFLVGTICCACAWSMEILLLGRTVQGLGGGLLIASSYTLVRELFPPEAWPRVYSLVSGAWGVAALLGPTVGGLFAQIGWWRGAFWIVTPLVVGAMLLAHKHVPRTAHDSDDSHPLPVGRLTVLGCAILAAALTGQVGTTTQILGLALVAVVAILCFVALDHRAPRHILPSGVFSAQNPVGAAFWILFLLAFAISPVGVFIPILMQLLWGTPPIVAGYFHAGEAFAWTVTTLLLSALPRQNMIRAIIMGPLLAAMGLLGLSVFLPIGSFIAIAAGVVMLGAGVGASWPHVSTVLTENARAREENIVATLIPTTQIAATAFGAAVANVIAAITGFSANPGEATATLMAQMLYGSYAIAPLAAAGIALCFLRRFSAR